VIERGGAEVGRARDRAMIGEISFIQGGAATATVVATKPCRYVAWSGEELRKLLRRNPSMDIAMKHVFNLDMMRKLTVRAPVNHERKIHGTTDKFGAGSQRTSQGEPGDYRGC
jgi:CRP-like cAMP-binding protein